MRRMPEYIQILQYLNTFKFLSSNTISRVKYGYNDQFIALLEGGAVGSPGLCTMQLAKKNSKRVVGGPGKKPKAIIGGMRSFAEYTNSLGVDGLITEFAELQERGPHPSSLTVNAQMQNKAKCRYFDIPCVDQTRVVLKAWPEAPSDFIHANWITHELLDNKIICTQGPMEASCGDLWRMVWQENVGKILMLCRVVENGKGKCYQYWPKIVGETKSYYGLTVKCDAVRNNDADVWCTDLILTYGVEQRKVTHYQWITWPDKFVPQQLVVPFMMLSIAKDSKGPVVIHCSAGIGRTGTLVVLQIVVSALLIGRDVSVPEIIWSIRAQRSRSVQCEEQYLYIHYIVIQRFLNKGILHERVVNNFCREYEQYYYARTHAVLIPLPVLVWKRPPADSSAKKNNKPKALSKKRAAAIIRAKKISKDDIDSNTATQKDTPRKNNARTVDMGTKTTQDKEVTEVEAGLVKAAEMVHEVLLAKGTDNLRPREEALKALNCAYQQAKTALDGRSTPSGGSRGRSPGPSSSPPSHGKTAPKEGKDKDKTNIEEGEENDDDAKASFYFMQSEWPAANNSAQAEPQNNNANKNNVCSTFVE